MLKGRVLPILTSDDELPPNVGNGDLVEEELVHVHEKCDHLMAQLKALNQAAGEKELAAEISPFVTPELITPVVTQSKEKLKPLMLSPKILNVIQYKMLLILTQI